MICPFWVLNLLITKIKLKMDFQKLSKTGFIVVSLFIRFGDWKCMFSIIQLEVHPKREHLLGHVLDGVTRV